MRPAAQGTSAHPTPSPLWHSAFIKLPCLSCRTPPLWPRPTFYQNWSPAQLLPAPTLNSPRGPLPPSLRKFLLV